MTPTVALKCERTRDLEELNTARVARGARAEGEEPPAPLEARAGAAGPFVPEEVRDERGRLRLVVRAEVRELELQLELVHVLDRLHEHEHLDDEETGEDSQRPSRNPRTAYHGLRARAARPPSGGTPLGAACRPTDGQAGSRT